MAPFEPVDPDYEKKVTDSFAGQPFMNFINAQLVAVKPGYCEIHLPYKNDLCQQHGYFHAGIIGTISDNCGGYAAFSLMPAGASVLTVEYKMNLVAPGDGELLIGQAKVIKPGRTLTICRTEVFVIKKGTQTLCATSLMTVMTMAGKRDLPLPVKR